MPTALPISWSSRTSRQPIDVWYGDHQQFGAPGEAQRWVNILGNVSTAGLSSLTYTLNGGPAQLLTIGPNGNRLEALGDFNIEIDYDQLNPSPVNDLARIRADYAIGESYTHDVTVAYAGGQQWPTDYIIDWAKVTDPPGGRAGGRRPVDVRCQWRAASLHGL
jgi:hypothetical protein